MSPAPIVVVEGLDGVGKTTLSTSLARALGARWLTTPGVHLRDPEVRRRFEAAFAASPLGRAVAYGATCIDAGAEARDIAARGRPVVIDRYWLSTRVYADPAIQAALDPLEPFVVPPTLTLFVTAPEAVRRSRLSGRGALTAADLDTLVGARSRELVHSYRALRHNPAAGAFIEVDASGAPEAVLERALACVRRAAVGAAAG